MPIQTSPPTPALAGAQAPPTVPSPSAIYEALTNQKEVLQGQLNDLVSQRQGLVSQLSDATESNLSGPAKTGLEDRIAGLDKQITALDQQIALSDAQISKAAAIPGAVVPRPVEVRRGPPDEVYILTGMFMFVVLLPLTMAYARRIWRRSATTVTNIPGDLMARIQRIEHAVETSGIEIERIGEGQRFITKLFSEKLNALPAAREEPRAPNS